MGTPEILSLENADGLVTLCPGLGAAIARFTWRGNEILRPAPESAIHERLVRQMGCYPLVPYSNRIGHADLIVGAQRTRLRANAPPEPHAIHGFGWQREWQVASQTEDAAELVLKHAPDIDWPFACEASQHIRLMDSALHLNLSVRNSDARPMPVGLGFHPFFPASRDTALQTGWKNMWKMGVDSLPTELIDVPHEADFSQPRRIDGWKVDNCFTGWNRCAVLNYPAHRVQLDAGTSCRQVVCFSPGRDFIALEPVTNINNAFALAARGVAGTGMHLLKPGDNLAISISILATERKGAKA